MYTLQQYIDDNVALAKSMVIKLTDIGVQINNSLKTIYNIDIPSDKHNWKYFLNISGQKHFTNTKDIQINILELDQIRPFSKDILDKYPDTRAALTGFSNYYNELIYKYPDDISYINGCIYPIEIDIAIKAAEGTILTYDKNLIEEQELSTVRELDYYIKDYLARWHIKNYMVCDELYMSSMLATLYASLPNKLMNIRLTKVRSNETHSFHVEHYFRSNFNLWDDIQVLNKKSLWWLYNNLEYIKKNTGKESTTELILDKIFNTNNVGVGKIMLGFQDATLKKSPAINESVYNDSVSKILSVKANNSYFMDNNKTRSTEGLIHNQLANDQITSAIYKNDAFYVDIFNNKLNSKNNVLEDTKTFDINSVKLLDTYGLNLFETITDTWTHKAFNDNYQALQYFVDPNTKLRYTLSPKQGFLILIKMLSLLYKDNGSVINNYYYNNVILPTYDKNILLDNLFTKDDLSDIADVILSKVPNVKFIASNKRFFNYIDRVLKLFETVKLIDSNIETLSISTDIKSIANRLAQRGVINISNGKTIDELLVIENIKLNVKGVYDPKKTIAELLLVFTGMNIDIYKKFTDINNHFISMFNKLTSYTTQISYTTDDAKSLYSKYTAISVNHISKGVIRTEAAHGIALEQEETLIKGMGNNFTDRLDGFFIDNISLLKYDNCGITGICEIIHEEDNIHARVTEPLVVIEVLKDCIPYYSPTIDTNSNTFVENITYNWVDYPNNLNYNNCVLTGLATISEQQRNIIGNVTEPAVVTEVLSDCVPYYSPIVTSASNNFTDTTTGVATDTNNIQQVSKVSIDPVIAYTGDNTTNNPTGGSTTPNVIVEIDI